MLRLKYRNTLRKIVVFFSLVAFVTANVGIAIYTHTCSISGTEKTLFLSYEDPCQDEHPVKKASCCSEDEHEEEHIDNSCCSTDTDYIALDIDTRSEKAQIQFIYDFVALNNDSAFSFYFSPELVSMSPEKLEFSNLPPPKFQGRDFQSIHQVYII